MRFLRRRPKPPSWYVPIEPELDRESFVDIYSAICDVVERTCHLRVDSPLPVDDGWKHTSQPAREATNAILAVLGIEETEDGGWELVGA